MRKKKKNKMLFFKVCIDLPILQANIMYKKKSNHTKRNSVFSWDFIFKFIEKDLFRDTEKNRKVGFCI